MKYSIQVQSKELTVEDLPSFILNLADRINELEATIQKHSVKYEQDGHRTTLGVDETARMLGLSKSRVYVLCGQGKLPSNKVGNRLLFFPEDLEVFIRSGGRQKLLAESPKWYIATNGMPEGGDSSDIGKQIESPINIRSNNKKADAL